MLQLFLKVNIFIEIEQNVKKKQDVVWAVCLLKSRVYLLWTNQLVSQMFIIYYFVLTQMYIVKQVIKKQLFFEPFILKN